MVYHRFRDSYVREDPEAYGDSVIPDEDTIAYDWGIIGETATHPTPRWTIEDAGVAVNEQEVADDEMWKQDAILNTGMYPLAIQNGVLLQAVMGGSSTAGADPYTHTITPPAAVAGVLPELPSFTIQHERYGSSDPWSTQFLGVKVASLLLTCGFDQKHMICRANWVAKKDEDVDFQLVNTPALPATANKNTYKFTNMTRTWDVDGTPLALDGLKYMELLISPDFDEERGPSWDDVTDDYLGDYLHSLIESPMKRYEFKMNYMPTSSVIYKELKQTGGTKKMVFKWTRSANDYIELTMTDCYLSAHPLSTFVKGQPDILECTMKPRKVEFEVKDSLPGSVYGE